MRQEDIGASAPIHKLIDSVMTCCTCGAAGECSCDDTPHEDGIPRAIRAGVLTLGEAKLRCYVLDNGQRIFNADDVERLLGGEVG